MAGLVKNEIYELFGQRGIKYEKKEHAAVFTMADMDAEGLNKKGNICKNLFLRDAKGKKHFLVSAPEERRIDLKQLAERLGTSKLSFASAERLEKYLMLRQGSVSPLGILNDEGRTVVFVADEALAALPSIGIHPNDNTATVWLGFGDLKKLIEEHGNEVIVTKLD